MQACGALYVKTRQAATFILNTLTAAREMLVEEFVRSDYYSVSTQSAHVYQNKIDYASPNNQLNLIIAVVLLQTVGLFHQKADQRASSGLFHGRRLPFSVVLVEFRC